LEKSLLIEGVFLLRVVILRLFWPIGRLSRFLESLFFLYFIPLSKNKPNNFEIYTIRNPSYLFIKNYRGFGPLIWLETFKTCKNIIKSDPHQNNKFPVVWIFVVKIAVDHSNGYRSGSTGMCRLHSKGVGNIRQPQ
jgi:hypothetical protein